MGKPSTEVKNYINEAQRRMQFATGEYLPALRRSFTFEDAGVRVTLHGSGLGHGPVADYEGPLGTWQASLSLRGSGAPRALRGV